MLTKKKKKNIIITQERVSNKGFDIIQLIINNKKKVVNL